MIRIERDISFWKKVAEHPRVAPHITLGHELDWSFIETDRVLPLASEHGGFLFFQLDGVGRVCELHTLYTPDGWGMEVLTEAKRAFDEVFYRGAKIVVTQEVDDNWKSRPPKSFGWKSAGDFEMVKHLDHAIKSWYLTSEAWGASPAKRRADRLCLS